MDVPEDPHSFKATWGEQGHPRGRSKGPSVHHLSEVGI